LPPLQLRSQLLPDSQTILHAPPVQSTLHGPLVSQVPSHCPAVQLQSPPVHASDVLAFPVGRGSGSAGAELHATSINRSKERMA
jgi:hypothetical protein